MSRNPLKEQWITTEERLLREADSMGAFLSRFRARVSPSLVGDLAWDHMLGRTRELPVTLAAFPFGFELPLHDPEPLADFGASIVGGSRSSAFFEERGRAEAAGTSAAGVAWLLDETAVEESDLRRIVGRKMLLEYDMAPAPEAALPEPGIFLYPDKELLPGGGADDRLRDLGIVVDAVARATGQELGVADRRRIEQAYLAMEPDTCLWGIGAFPSRGGGIRLAVTGFKEASGIVAFLDRIGWPGPRGVVEASVRPLEERGAFAYMGVHLDMGPEGAGPKLGLSFYAKENEWLKGFRHWAPLVDGIREAGLAVPEKLSELEQWSQGPETVPGASGQFLLVRGMHHIKFVLVGDRVEQVKGYVFMLLLGWPLAV